MTPDILPLSQLKVGERGVITKMNIKGAARQRFLAMGLIKGETILVKRVAPLGDPIDFVIKGYDLSLRKSEAAEILVQQQGQQE
jgi:Fe2+ transport system protein FeoA